MQQRVTDLASHCDLVRHAWSELHTALGRADMHQLLVRRVDDVIGWVLGPGEELLASQELIGRDVASSERLIELHDNAELQCRVSATFKSAYLYDIWLNSAEMLSVFEL